MNDYALVYIIWSLLVGLLYTLNWYFRLNKLPKNLTKFQNVAIFIIVYVISSIFAPLSLYEGFKSTIQEKEKRR